MGPDLFIRRGIDVVTSPVVSVIIPAYKVASYIAETLDSALAQSFKNYEIIVINDGSPDTEEFEDVLAPYLNQIIYLKIPNIGAGAARNIGIENSSGEFIAFLDGDDIWLPEFLESQVNFLESNNYDLVYTDALLFGGSIYDGKTFMEDAPSLGEADFESLLETRCNVITSGTVARRKNIREAGMFETEKVRAHDFVLWLRIAKNGGRIGYQRQVLLKYRVRLDSLSGNSVERVQREIDVYHRIIKLIELDERQKKIVEKQLIRLHAEMEIELGKSFFLQKDFAAARQAFEKGNQYRRSNQLRLIIFLLKIAPNLLLKLYKSRRAEEIAFIPSN
jgi:teichuronic acid biosynthesis glycosyltransferase TuaG